MSKGLIFDIKEFTVHDGPGVRVTVFLKGCPLRCKWCHNPEGLLNKPQVMVRENECLHCDKCRLQCNHAECRGVGRCLKICPKDLVKVVGEYIEAEDLASRLIKYEDFLKMTYGGITLSGGEPLMQPTFTLELLEKLCHIHTAVETSGYGDSDSFKKIINAADLVLFDIKHTDTKIHKKFTGVGNELIIKNLMLLIESNRLFIARIPLIPGVNDTEENIDTIAGLLEGARGLKRVEILPYNPFAGAKYAMLGEAYRPEFDVNAKPKIFLKPFEKRGILSTVL